MCGIAGVWEREGREADAKRASRMLDPMLHRGPDDRGSFSNGPVALGHLRLSILDPSARAHQPIASADGQGVLVYNGEVYNAPELRAGLEREGVPFRSRSDSEVVLQALHHWGPAAAIPRFDGMFAFAYWDARDRALWLARDRMGIKPLYVAETGTALLFASEIKALLSDPAVEAQPDLHALSIRLARGYLVGRRTPFCGIEALEPGTHWKLSGRGVAVARYYDPIEALDVERLQRAEREPPAVHEAAFERAFGASVRMHLASDAPLAAACSGGVDSSLIAALAQRDRPGLTGWVAASEGADRDARYAERVGRHLALPIRRVELDRLGYARLAAEATWHNELPLVYPASAALLALTRACHADGTKVLLTGEGADELFGGYRWYAQIHRQRRRRRQLGFLSAGASRSTGRFGRTGAAQLPLDMESEHRRRRLLEKLAPIRPIEDRIFLANSLGDLHEHFGSLLQHHDRMGMAASIEMRVPFLQNDLIDLALHLPRRAKLHRGVGKWVVKRVAAKHLPRDVVYARKRGFPMPAEAYRLPRELIRGGVLAELFGWSADETETLLESASGDGLRSFRLGSFELWARLFLRGESQQRLTGELLRSPAVA